MPFMDMPFMDLLTWQQIALFVGTSGGAKEIKRVLGAGGGGRVRGYEGISCGREQAFRVERDAAAVRCVSYDDVSAVAEEAYYQALKATDEAADFLSEET
ncbi:hypothetical protein V6N13_122052 [Hibiscus sabdariffa]|uniref:Uncharacterized protein n=1 Tax=Hibiscus sabdariffa TaxID=183260 RepID=A0ABR2C6P2_9ROSI